MKIIAKAMFLLVLVSLSTACSSLAPQPTGTPIPTETQAPTSTSTPEPTSTPTDTPVPPTETPSAPVLQLPVGEPADEWEGIPVMPNAIAGEGDSAGYTFIIAASLEEIQTFYEQELAKLGWNMFASGQGATDAVLLIFMQGTDILSFSIIPQPDGIMYVMWVK